MKADLGDIDFRELFSAAVMQTLDSEKKDHLIKQAIQHLLTPDGYGREKRTPLEEAFNSAMRQTAHKYIAEFLEKDESIKPKIADLLKEAMQRIFETNRDDTVNKVADKIIEGLYRDRY